MATKKKIAIIVILIISLIVFLLETLGLFELLKDKLLLTHDYIGENKVIFADVGDSNCAIVQSGGKTAIFNFGGVKDGGNSLIKAIRKYRITKIDYAFITICDENHLGGFIAISNLVDIDKIIIPNINDFTYDNSLTSLAVKDKILKEYSYETLTLNKSYKLGEFSFIPFYYQPQILSSSGRAVLYKICANNYSAVIGGSFDSDIMFELFMDYKDLNPDIFLLPGFSNNQDWNWSYFNGLKAKYLISSSAFKNNFATQQDFELLESEYKLYRTDINGDVVFYFNNDGLLVKTER